MILVFIICKNAVEAKKIGLVLLKKRLAACFIVIPGVTSFYFWPPSQTWGVSPRRGGPPRKNKIEKSREAILLVKTLRKKFPQMERQVKKIHSYSVPLIAEISVSRVNKEYQKWLEEDLK